jgi:hypothetical protein
MAMSRRDPVRLGLALAGVSELYGVAVLVSRDGLPSGLRRQAEGASVRLALASLLLVSSRRSDWRTPALVAATLSGAFLLATAASLPGEAHRSRTRARSLLLGLRVVALAGLLRESSRADGWEGPS